MKLVRYFYELTQMFGGNIMGDNKLMDNLETKGKEIEKAAKEKANEVQDVVTDKTEDIKEAAMDTKSEIQQKVDEENCRLI